MGTYYRVSLVADGEPRSLDLQQHIEQELAAVNQAMSTYLPDSELSQLNQAPAGQALNLSDELEFVLSAALDIAKDSGGALDPTIGPLVDLWGFGPSGRRSEHPSSKQVQSQLSRVGYQMLSLGDGAMLKQTAEVSIDLSAIAKGYAIDRIAEFLFAQNLENWLIDVGGELRANGVKNGQAWRVAVETPDTTGSIQAILELADQAIATSGDYRNFIELDGKRYSHAIDPASGYPIDDPLASVTVLHPSAMLADAYATALLVMGLERARSYCKDQQFSCYLIFRTSENAFDTDITGEFVFLSGSNDRS